MPVRSADQIVMRPSIVWSWVCDPESGNLGVIFRVGLGALAAMRTLQLPKLKKLLDLFDREAVFWVEAADFPGEGELVSVLFQLEEHALREIGCGPLAS